MKNNKGSFVGITMHVDSGQDYDLYPGHPLQYVERDTINIVKELGFIPYLIPVYEDGSLPPLDHLSAIIITGGGFLNLSESNSQLSTLYTTGKERYEAEKRIINYGLNKNLPIVGFCRGAQMINEVLGGSLANIPVEGIEHHQERLNIPAEQTVHEITINKNSQFYSLTNQEQLSVNSFHRQHMNRLGKGLRSVATSTEDGIVEIFESEDQHFIFGFQFHPEKLWKNDPVWLTFFKEFAAELSNY